MKLFKDRKEFLVAFSIAVAAASFSLLPTIYAWLNTPEGYWFTGVSSYFDPWDINAYFSAMRQGFDGSWLYRNPYQPSDVRRLPIQLAYLFLGRLTRTFDLPIPSVYHAVSFVLGVVFLLTVYFFVRFFLKDKFWSLVCLFLVAFGGGFGFFGLPEGKLLPDTAWPDATTFSTLHLPHFMLDQLFFLGVLFFSYRALTKSNWRCGFAAAVLGIGLGFIHPYSLTVATVIVGIFFIGFWVRGKSWRQSKLLLPLLLVSLPTVGYFFKIFYLDTGGMGALWSNKAASLFLTPPLPVLFLSYGLVAALALIGAHRLWKEKTSPSLLLLSWSGGQLLMLYFPVSWQRIMIKSFFIVLCLLAVWGMRALSLRKNWISLAMILFFSSLTNISIQALTVAGARPGNIWVYLSAEECEALEWVRENLSGETILAPLELSTMIPAYSSNSVYCPYRPIPSEVECGLETVGASRLEEVYKDGEISIFKTVD